MSEKKELSRPVFKDYYQATLYNTDSSNPIIRFQGQETRYMVAIRANGEYSILDLKAAKVMGANYKATIQGKLELQPNQDPQPEQIDLEGLIVMGLGDIIEIVSKQESTAKIVPIKHDLSTK